MRRVLFISCAIVSMASATAQSFLPPPELVEQALQQQAEVLASESQRAATESTARAVSMGSYEFETTIAPLRRRTDRDGDFDEYEVQLSRSIRLPGKASLDREMAAKMRTVASLEHQAAVRAAGERLLELWMGWLRAAATDEVAREQEASLQTEYEALATRVRMGDAAQLDLDLFNAELAQARVTRLRSETALALARRALRAEFPQIPLPHTAPTIPLPQQLDGANDTLSARIMEASLTVQAKEADAARQSVSAARARADRIADPTLGVRFLDESNGEERSVGLVVTVPFGGGYRRQLAAAEHASARAAQQLAQAVRRDAQREADTQVAYARDSFLQWAAQRTARTAMDTAAGRVHRAWELGQTGLVDRLLAERRARETAYQELAVRADVHEAQLRVRLAIGELWRFATDGVEGRAQ